MKRIGMMVLLLLAGCGGGGMADGPGPAAIPVLHVLTADTPATMPAAAYRTFGPYVLPAATADYTVTNRSTTTPDHWDTGFATQAEVAFLNAGQAWQAYAPHQGVSTVSDSAAVPAGTYYLVVICRNLLEDCQLSYAVDATYCVGGEVSRKREPGVG